MECLGLVVLRARVEVTNCLVTVWATHNCSGSLGISGLVHSSSCFHPLTDGCVDVSC